MSEELRIDPTVESDVVFNLLQRAIRERKQVYLTHSFELGELAFLTCFSHLIVLVTLGGERVGWKIQQCPYTREYTLAVQDVGGGEFSVGESSMCLSTAFERVFNHMHAVPAVRNHFDRRKEVRDEA